MQLQPNTVPTVPVGGMVLARRGEMLGSGQFLYLRNIRANTPTTLQSRNGYLPLNNTVLSALNVHTIRKLNNYLDSVVKYVAGAGTTLQSVDSGGGTSLLTGFSGNPLTMVSAQPLQSPAPWLYVGDSSRMGKVGVVGGSVVGYNMGIAAPSAPCSATLGGEPIKVLDDFDVTTGWAASAGVITNPDRINTTIAAILYDSGSTGYANIVPTSFTQDIQPDILLDVDGVQCKIHSVYPAITATTIASISYDSGSTGPCSMVLLTPSNILKQDALLRLDSGGPDDEYVRVEAIIPGPAGQTSIRCTTVNTQVAGHTAEGIASFRAYLTNTAAVSDTLVSKSLQLAIAGAGTITLDKTVSLDLSNIGTRAVSDADDLHLSLKVSNPSAITEIQLRLDVDRTTNDFTQNYFLHSIRPSDLVPITEQSLTTLAAQQVIIQREQIEQAYVDPRGRDYFLPEGGYYGSGAPYSDPYYDPSYYPPTYPVEAISGANNQTAAGASQWTELVVKLSSLVRIGTDTGVTLKDVKALRISIVCTAAVDITADSWWIGGTYGPDCRPSGFGYSYWYAYRSRKTGGGRSNPSPFMRTQMFPKREQVTIVGDRSTDPQTDTVDVFRQGGTLSTIQYLGSVANPGSGQWTFVDTLDDGEIIQNDSLEFDNFQPFPTADQPRSGTLNVRGTAIEWASGDTFNTAWARGSIIVINGKATRLYTNPSSTTRAEITENLGTLTGVAFELPNALLVGQPLPVLVGPYTQGGPEYIFGLGDDTGNLYWTKAGRPDSASDANYVTVTSPSEPLIAGAMYDGRVILWSTERMFFVQPDGLGGFVTQEIANSRGCLHSWAVCVNQLIYFIGKEGIYESEGGQPRLISGPLYDMFPNETSDSAPLRAVDMPPVLYTNPTYQRLFTYGNYVYFCYQNTAGGRRTLVWDIQRRVWISDDLYANTPVCFYGEEGRDVHGLLMGSDDGYIYRFGASLSDNGTDIPMLLRAVVKDGEWWRHLRALRFAHSSEQDTVIDVEMDGAFTTYVFPATGGTYRNYYQPTRPTKGKSLEFTIRATQGFVLFVKDCAFEQKAWPNSQGYTVFNPFA